MIVAVEAKQFPVAAIRGVVVVVVVSMVNRQLSQRLAFKLSGTTCADMGKHLESLLPESSLALLFLFPHFCRDQGLLLGVRFGHKNPLGEQKPPDRRGLLPNRLEKAARFQGGCSMGGIRREFRLQPVVRFLVLALLGHWIGNRLLSHG